MWLRNLNSKSILKRLFTVKYNVNHEWINYDEKTKIGVVGITEYAQNQLGDIVHISLPSINSKFKQGEIIATIESVKVVDDIYLPLSGTIIEVNKLLETSPELVNESAEDKGWIAKLQLDNIDEAGSLLDAEGYSKHVEEIKASH